jgi:hypothetical protein
MSWLSARARIAVLLGKVELAEPVKSAIAKVYPTPPGTIGDLPCFIIYPPALKVERGQSGLRIKTYTVRLRLLVSDADLDQAADLVDAYREAVVDMFDTDVRLSDSHTRIQGPTVEEAGQFTYGGRDYTGMDCLLTVIIEEPRNFS